MKALLLSCVLSLFVCSVSFAASQGTRPLHVLSAWNVARGVSWVHYHAESSDGKDRDDYYVYEHAGKSRFYKLDFYRPSAKWTLRQYLRTLSKSEASELLRKAKTAIASSATNAEPSVGLFIFSDGWPSVIGSKSVRESAGIKALRGMHFDMTTSDRGSVSLLSDRKGPHLVALYEAGCSACEHDLSFLASQAKAFENNYKGDVHLVSFTEPRVAEKQLSTIEDGSLITVVDGRGGSLRNALETITMPRTYFVRDDGTVWFLFVGSTPPPFIDAMAKRSL